MIQPISNRLFQTGNYFTILKFMILQQNITSVWIFGDQNSWFQYGQEMNGILQHLVGTLPKYVFDMNHTKELCVDIENVRFLNIFFVSESFGSNELDCICPTDYTMVLLQNSSTKIDLPEKNSSHILQRIVFGTINSSTIADFIHFPDKPMTDLFTGKSLKSNTSIFRIFSHFQPPRSMVFSFDNKTIIFAGADALLVEDIIKMLNATNVVIKNDFGIEMPHYSFVNDSDTRLTKAKKLAKFHKRILSSHTISDYRQK